MDPNGPQLHIPVNPEEITICRDKNIETVNIINLGEIDFSYGEKVSEIAFSSFFPAVYDESYCRYPNLPEPSSVMQQLTTWANSQTPVRILISNTPINDFVMVASFKSTFKGGEPDDIYYDLTLRTWREVKVTPVASSTMEAARGNAIRPRTDVKPVAKTYTVKPGDSLFNIAKIQLGDSSKWRDLYTANKATIGSRPELIKPGMKLVMPI